MSLPSELVRSAEALARRAHADQRRKGGEDVPYFNHVESVARRLRDFGVADEGALAAAYLHDVLEDRPAFADELRRTMPTEVVATVEVLTEQKMDAAGAKRPKQDRFRDYVDGLRADTHAARRAALVSCADKIDNLVDLVATQKRGVELLSTLSTRPGQHAAQLAALREVYAPRVPPVQLEAFDRAAAELAETIRKWLPGHAAAIAARAHVGQFDKSGAPYILHPMRLMIRATTPEEQMAAALHDVLEDDDAWSLETLAAEGFPPEVLDALDCLTKRENEPYEAFVQRVMNDPLARRVKILDLEDNMDVTRLTEMTREDLARLERYHRAHRALTAAR